MLALLRLGLQLLNHDLVILLYLLQLLLVLLLNRRHPLFDQLLVVADHVLNVVIVGFGQLLNRSILLFEFLLHRILHFQQP